MTPDQVATLSRIDERTKNTKESLDDHIEDDHQRFERTFNYVKDSFNKMDERLEKIDARLGTLWDGNNRQEGAFGLGKWVAGLVGGGVATLLHFIANQHGGTKP